MREESSNCLETYQRLPLLCTCPSLTSPPHSSFMCERDCSSLLFYLGWIASAIRLELFLEHRNFLLGFRNLLKRGCSSCLRGQDDSNATTADTHKDARSRAAAPFLDQAQSSALRSHVRGSFGCLWPSPTCFVARNKLELSKDAREGAETIHWHSVRTILPR